MLGFVLTAPLFEGESTELLLAGSASISSSPPTRFRPHLSAYLLVVFLPDSSVAQQHSALASLRDTTKDFCLHDCLLCAFIDRLDGGFFLQALDIPDNYPRMTSHNHQDILSARYYLFLCVYIVACYMHMMLDAICIFISLHVLPRARRDITATLEYQAIASHQAKQSIPGTLNLTSLQSVQFVGVFCLK